MRQGCSHCAIWPLLTVVFIGCGAARATEPETAFPIEALTVPMYEADNTHYDLDHAKVAKVLKTLGRDEDVLAYQAKTISSRLIQHHKVYVLNHMDSEFLSGITLLYEPVEKRIIGAFVRNEKAVSSSKCRALFNEMLNKESLGTPDDAKVTSIALLYLAFSGQPAEPAVGKGSSPTRVRKTSRGFVVSVTTLSPRRPMEWQVVLNQQGRIESVGLGVNK